MAKATHTGTCQVCGHHQKLPNGRLSLHGYTKEWGFFNGQCWGSKELPFEVSKDLIEESIQRATEQCNANMTEAAALRDGRQFDNDLAWQHVYLPGRSFSSGSRGYQWQKVPVTAKSTFYGEGEDKRESVTFTYLANGSEKPQRIDLYDHKIKTLDAARKAMNIHYAERVLDKSVEDLNRYIAWQQQRIKDWKPTELKPIEPVVA